MNIIADAQHVCDAATAGPWEAVNAVPSYKDQGWVVRAGNIDICSFADEGDARFIAEARSLVPALVAEIERVLHLLDSAVANRVPPALPEHDVLDVESAF